MAQFHRLAACDPNWPWSIAHGAATLWHMQVITSRRGRRVRPAAFAAVLGSGVVGATLIVTGIVLGWLVFATPLLQTFQAPLRATTSQTVVSVAAWIIAL